MIPSARDEVLGITNKECHCVNKMSSGQQIDCMNGIVSPHKHVCPIYRWKKLKVTKGTAGLSIFLLFCCLYNGNSHSIP